MSTFTPTYDDLALAGNASERDARFVLLAIQPLSVESAYADPLLGRLLAVVLGSIGKGVLAKELAKTEPAVHELSVDAIVNRWTEDDPRWDLLPTAA